MNKGFVIDYMATEKKVEALLSIHDEQNQIKPVRILIEYRAYEGYCVTTQVSGSLLCTETITGNMFSKDKLKSSIIEQLKVNSAFKKPNDTFFTDLSERMFESTKGIKREKPKEGAKIPVYTIPNSDGKLPDNKMFILKDAVELKAIPTNLTTGARTASFIKPELKENVVDSVWNQPIEVNKPVIEERKETKMKVKFHIDNISIDNTNQTCEWLVTPEVDDQTQTDNAFVVNTTTVEKEGENAVSFTDQNDESTTISKERSDEFAEFLVRSYKAEDSSIDKVVLDFDDIQISLVSIYNTHETMTKINRHAADKEKSTPVEVVVSNIVEPVTTETVNHHAAPYEMSTEPKADAIGSTRAYETMATIKVAKAECASLVFSRLGKVRFCIGDGKYNQLSILINNEFGEEIARYTENNFVEEDVLDNIEKIERVTNQVMMHDPLSSEEDTKVVFFTLSVLVGKYHNRLKG